MCKEDYKQILDDDISKRPTNCHALAPVECNTQILEALKVEAKKADFRMKEVSKDILKAATIIITVLLAPDRITQTIRHEGVAHGVVLINGTLALLGNTNYHNNLVKRFLIKHEINPRYNHLC
ncbi:hypothetical protein E2C01_032972 [Portunus trituberculatus]|uniref:Uncharacterized protein n=1 Tax=Portunus trituberculatus TaxID=210409 RepID=A0A5B7F260_PORTR|nr:hypothetical protein [Portunus trituberculatus]